MTHADSTRTHFFALSRLAWVLGAVFVAASVVLPGCKGEEHTDDDGHDHAQPGEAAAAGHAEGDGHDHGGNGEAEHADEVVLTADASLDTASGLSRPNSGSSDLPSPHPHVLRSTPRRWRI